ncbi:MAG TPA: hypothetical protein VG711_04295, partial [Phycisphaerales bacterium]|nr:hypothetical protein [Phycisphaerales bacterium]
MRIQYLGLSGLVHFARTLLTFAFAFLFVVQALTVCVAHPQEGNGNSGGNEDLSGDDVKDNVAGDPNADPSGMHHAGQVIVRSGVGNTLLATIRGGSIGDRFGASVATVGDVNLDGEIDLLVGATRAGGRGRVYLFNGPFKADDNGAIHVLDLSAADAAWVFNPNYLDDKDFGFAVAPLYDLDGDGFADLRIMSWAQQSDGSEVSRTYVYSGNQSLWSVTDGPFLVGTLDGAISWELWTPVIGDLDANGAIDSDDLIRLTANIGMTGTSNSRLSVLDGDLNLDNSVDATDLAILMDQFGFKAYADILPPGSNLHICGLVIGSGQTTGGVWCDGHQGTGNQHPGGTNNGGNGNGGNGNNGGGSGNGNGTGIGDGSGNCLKITTPNDSDVQCINTPVCMQAELSPGIYPPCDHVTWNVTDSAPGGQQQGGMTSGSATFDNGSSSTSLEPGEDACIIFDEPGEYVISGSYCGYCTGTKRLTVTNVELTPDPETHLDDTKITILPGDIENVTATYDVSPDKIWFKIVDSTIAEFKLDDGIYADTVAGSSSPQELHILGRANGDTIL